MIPAEAVEAAARAIYQNQTGMDWESRSDVLKETVRADARAALEAAAPHMMHTATSLEELRALPGGSIVLDADGDLSEKPYHEPRWWHQMGTYDSVDIADIKLPAKVLWEVTSGDD